jgi:hypothetical protein
MVAPGTSLRAAPRSPDLPSRKAISVTHKLRAFASNDWVILISRYSYLACVSVLLAISLVVSIFVFRNQSVPHSRFMDFTVFWTAARFKGDVYDVSALTAAQLDHLPAHWDLRPFPYPPSTLLLIKPLSLLEYDSAFRFWTVAGMAAFCIGGMLLGRRAVFALTMLPVGIALLAGQISLFIGGALAAAVALLPRSEIAAGVLFGLVAAIKPQSAALVPVALIAGGHWRSLCFSAASFGLIVLASLSLGPHLWLDWAQALRQFAQEIRQPGYAELNVAFGPGCAPIGLALVAFTFWGFRSPSARLLALVAGTLLCLPYMLLYDLAPACPALAILLLAPLDNSLPASKRGRRQMGAG